MTGRRGPRVGGAVLVGAVLVAGLLAGPGPGGAASPPQRALPPAPPLAGAVTTDGGSWATVPMGHLDDPLNTFWQTFHLGDGGGRWRLVTPPGVADNGGLVIAAGEGDEAAAGFEPSQLLTFSPLATTADGGGAWAPALAPGALADGPDALAVSTGGSDGESLALLGRGASTVVAEGNAALGGWHTIAAARGLSRAAGPSCGIDGLDAVTLAPGPLVGTGCTTGGRVGLFARGARGWTEVGPRLPARSGSGATRVLRLTTQGSLVTAVVASTVGGVERLTVVWGQDAGNWQLSPPLTVAGPVTSVSLGAGGATAVLWSGPSGMRLEQVVAGGSWTALPAPPAGTKTVALLGGSEAALVVHGSQLDVVDLDPGSLRWRRAQALSVPIAYGSSN